MVAKWGDMPILVPCSTKKVGPKVQKEVQVNDRKV